MFNEFLISDKDTAKFYVQLFRAKITPRMS